SDTAPPTVSITSPVAGSTVSGIVAVAANASDNVGVTRVELRANTTLVGTKTTAPYQLNGDSTTVADGGVTLIASAFDAADNTATATFTFTTLFRPSDTAPPTVSITAPAAGSTVSGIVAVAVSAADNVGVTRVELRANTTL